MPPKPKPAGLKLLEGRGHGRDSGGRKVVLPPAFKRLPPARPDDLSPRAGTWWDGVVPELVRLELVKEADAAALTMAAETFARWRDALDEVRRDGLSMSTSQGRSRNPALISLENAERSYRSWCAEFGLTPSAEGRLNPPEPPVPDDDGNPFARQNSARNLGA